MALRAHNLAKHFILLTYLVTYFLIHCLLYPLSLCLFCFCLSLCYSCFVSVSASLSPCLSVSVCLSLSVCLPVSLCVCGGGRGSMINFWVPYRGQRILYWGITETWGNTLRLYSIVYSWKFLQVKNLKGLCQCQYTQKYLTCLGSGSLGLGTDVCCSPSLDASLDHISPADLDCWLGDPQPLSLVL